jgi:hypothetical protein
MLVGKELNGWSSRRQSQVVGYESLDPRPVYILPGQRVRGVSDQYPHKGGFPTVIGKKLRNRPSPMRDNIHPRSTTYLSFQ